MDGWIKLYWRAKESPGCTSAVAMGVWAHLLLRASYRERTLRNGQSVQPGDVIISESGFAENLGVSRKIMRRLLNRFDDLGMIEVVKRDRNGTHLSISNWTTYQNQEAAGEHERNNKGTIKRQQRNMKETAKEHERDSKGTQTKIPKKVKRPKKGERAASPKRARPGSLEEVRAYWQHAGLKGSPVAFWNHYQARNWRGIADWIPLAANWSLREAEFAKGDSRRPADIDLTIPQGGER